MKCDRDRVWCGEKNEVIDRIKETDETLYAEIEPVLKSYSEATREMKNYLAIKEYYYKRNTCAIRERWRILDRPGFIWAQEFLFYKKQ